MIMTVTLETLGELVQYTITIKKIRLGDLSKKSGVSRKTIWRITKGDLTVGMDKYKKIFDALELKVNFSTEI
jgi:hypothetical protein